MNSTPPNKEDISKFWYLLNENDKKEYLSLFSMIKENNIESKLKKKRIPSFNDTIELIHKYAIRGDSGDTARSIICGILWLENSIAINSHRLGFLMSKCKSSINGSLQMLGYKEITSKRQTSEIVGGKISSITNDRNEVRKWTIRTICKMKEQDSNETIQNQNMNQNQNLPKEIPKEIEIINKKPQNNQINFNNPYKRLFLVSRAPIESIYHQENDRFIKEEIILNEVFRSIDGNQNNNAKQLHNNDLTMTDIFFD